MNPNKYSFCASNFECLGYLVDGNCLKPDMREAGSLTNAQSPKNLTELHSLVSAFYYYSHFIPNFSCTRIQQLSIKTFVRILCSPHTKQSKAYLVISCVLRIKNIPYKIISDIYLKNLV